MLSSAKRSRTAATSRSTLEVVCCLASLGQTGDFPQAVVAKTVRAAAAPSRSFVAQGAGALGCGPSGWSLGLLSPAGRHSGPTASAKTNTLNSTFDGLPEAIEPALSKQNQAPSPARTARRTASGARSYTDDARNHTVTPQPNRKPPVSADRKCVSGWPKVVAASIGQLSRSSVNRAGSLVAGIVPRKNTGPKEPITKAVSLSQRLCDV